MRCRSRWRRGQFVVLRVLEADLMNPLYTRDLDPPLTFALADDLPFQVSDDVLVRYSFHALLINPHVPGFIEPPRVSAEARFAQWHGLGQDVGGGSQCV